MDFLRTLQTIRSPFLDAVCGSVTRLGEELFAIAVMCWIYWCVSKRLAYGIGITYFISGIFVQGLKIGFRIERPWVKAPDFLPVESALEHATGYSFPSGHTQSAAALFGSAGFSARRGWLRVCCFAAAALVGFSRMYLGVHTPADVLAGLVLTLIAAFVSERLFVKEEPSRRRSFAVLVLILLLGGGVTAFALFLMNTGKLSAPYLYDCLKAAGAAFGFALGMFLERSYIHFSTETPKFWMQPVKYVSGLAGTLAIKEGFKLIIGTGLAADALRYCLMLLWISALYPLIIKKAFQNR